MAKTEPIMGREKKKKKKKSFGTPTGRLCRLRREMCPTEESAVVGHVHDLMEPYVGMRMFLAPWLDSWAQGTSGRT
mgnify:CR=1 FL=1